MTAGLVNKSSAHRLPQTAAIEGIIVRDAIEADLSAIVEIHNAAIASGISTAQLERVTVKGRREWLRAHSPAQYPIWVAELGGAIAGWLSFREFLPRCAYRGTVEVSVYVHETFRRRGIGRRLLQQAIARGPQLEMHSLVGLIFSTMNQVSRSFALPVSNAGGSFPASHALIKSPAT